MFVIIVLIMTSHHTTSTSALRGKLAMEIPSTSWGKQSLTIPPHQLDHRRHRHQFLQRPFTFFQTDSGASSEVVTKSTGSWTAALSQSGAQEIIQGSDTGYRFSTFVVESLSARAAPAFALAATVALFVAAAIIMSAFWRSLHGGKVHVQHEGNQAQAEDAQEERKPCDAHELSNLANLSEHEMMLMREIANLPRYTVDDISPARAPYDCGVVIPQEERALVRLQGNVVAMASPAQAPLTHQECTMCTTCAAELRLDGVQAPPVSFVSIGSDFYVDMLASGARDSERVRVSGSQVSLTGMVDGRHYRLTLFGDCSPEVQDLVRGNKPNGKLNESKLLELAEMDPNATLNESTVLELTESCLSVGAEVTCVGKLHRAATGQLHLLPPDVNYDRESSEGQLVTAFGKVVVSDNPFLLDGGK